MEISHNYKKLQLMIFPIYTSWGPVWFAQQKENKRRDRKGQTKNLWFGFSIPQSLSLSLQTVKVIGFTRPSLFFPSKMRHSPSLTPFPHIHHQPNKEVCSVGHNLQYSTIKFTKNRHSSLVILMAPLSSVTITYWPLVMQINPPQNIGFAVQGLDFDHHNHIMRLFNFTIFGKYSFN